MQRETEGCRRGMAEQEIVGGQEKRLSWNRSREPGKLRERSICARLQNGEELRLSRGGGQRDFWGWKNFGVLEEPGCQ